MKKHYPVGAATGPGSDKLVGFSVEKGNGIVGWVGKHKRSTIVYDANKDERFIGKRIRTLIPGV